MELHRFFITWLLVVGLVGVYAQNYDEDISEELAGRIIARPKYPQLDERASTPNPANEDYSSEEDAISEFVNEARLHKRSNPNGMPKEDLDWHFEEGEKTLKRLSEEKKTTKELNREWVARQMQTGQWKGQAAANDKKGQSQQNRPGTSGRSYTNL